jgi:cardiolipin-specific phospholipase
MFNRASEARKRKKLRTVEAKLIDLAKTFGNINDSAYDIVLKDTPIPFEVLPLKKKKRENKDPLFLHSVCARAADDSLIDETKSERKATPLVLLHGYMNGSMYFYRNLVGLTSFFETVYSLDMLGFGLSSRRPKLLKSEVVDNSVETTEALYVESLEAWRKESGISKMILGGHSLGGYIGVAYCEKYPQHVDQLLLLSPVGVNHPKLERIEEWLGNLPLLRRIRTKIKMAGFEVGITPGHCFRNMPRWMGRKMVTDYIKERMHIEEEDQEALGDYLYFNGILPGTGEYMANRILLSSLHARVPLVDRIPKLQVSNVSFLYGESDWMETDGGVDVLKICQSQNAGPEIGVFEVQDAGHLMMLDNWRGTHAGIITMCGGGETIVSSDFPKPLRRLNQKEVIQTLYLTHNPL